jgi:hypothetical protein
MSPTTLQNDATLVSLHGDTASAKRLLRHLADHRGWCDETMRARWDGVAALLAWWHSLEPALRPPLWDLSPDDARSFLEYLESMDLARSTLNGYRIGASGFSAALRAYRSSPGAFDPAYAPFKDVYPTRDQKEPFTTDIDLTPIASPITKARLELLLALLHLGMSVPEACSRTGMDLNASRRLLVGYRHRTVVLGAQAVTALETLEKLKPSPYRNSQLIGWRPATARKWLRRIEGGT